jgi:hypothetical protein
MTMALERGIALTAFTVGLVVVLLALVGCDEDGEPVLADGCPSAHHAHPIFGRAYRDDRTVVRLVSPGEPCGYADDFHGGTLFVELRRPSDQRVETENLVCVDATLKRRAPARTRLSPMSRGRAGSDKPKEAIEALLRDPDPCPSVTRIQASFVID